MVDQSITQRVQSFLNAWNSTLKTFPKYVLDFTYPSIGVLDRLIAPLRGQQEFQVEERELIDLCACYLGGLAHDCWLQFSEDVQAELRRAEDSGNIILTALKGPGLSAGKTFSVNLTETLEKIISAQDAQLPIFADFSIKQNQTATPLSHFATGLMSGLCPHGMGEWASIAPKNFKSSLIAAEQFLAGTCASWYSRNFPAENIGANPQIYQAQLIFPPIGYEEPFPASRAVFSLSTLLKAFDCSVPEMSSLAVNLTFSPNELISAAGFSFYVALSEEVTDTLHQLPLAVGKPVSELRTAVALARSNLGKPQGWIQLLEADDLEGARKMFKLDREAGLCQAIHLDTDDCCRKELLPLMHQLYWGRLTEAESLFPNLIPDPSSTLLIQKGFLALSLNKIEEAIASLSAIGDFDALSPYYQAEYYELYGLLAVVREDRQHAAEALSRALNLSRPDSHEHLRRSELLKAFDLQSESESKSREEIAEELVEAYRLHPWDPAVLEAIRYFFVR